LLAAAVVINRGEELAARDRDFDVIAEDVGALGLRLRVTTP
jgi:predicted nucleic acid-binding protein